MEDLFIRCREIVKDNITKGVDADLIELISLAMTVLMLLKPKQTIERLPKILNDLDIIADSRSVIDIAHEDLNDYMEDEGLKNSDAAVIREILADEDLEKITEKRHLLVSLNDCNYTNILCVLVHEFFHLLRFFEVFFENNKITTSGGFASIEYDCGTDKMRRENYYFEEGVVQFYTIEAINLLVDYLDSNEKTKNCCFRKLDVSVFGIEKKKYLLQTSLIKEMVRDEEFKKRLYDSFEDCENCSNLMMYFNSVFENPFAFKNFSEILDNTYEKLVQADNSYIEGLKQLRMLTEKFLAKTKKRR